MWYIVVFYAGLVTGAIVGVGCGVILSAWALSESGGDKWRKERRESLSQQVAREIALSSLTHDQSDGKQTGPRSVLLGLRNLRNVGNPSKPR